MEGAVYQKVLIQAFNTFIRHMCLGDGSQKLSCSWSRAPEERGMCFLPVETSSKRAERYAPLAFVVQIPLGRRGSLWIFVWLTIDEHVCVFGNGQYHAGF
jgi:hypothetical protein